LPDEKKQTMTDKLNQFRAASKLATTELYGTTEKMHDDNTRDLSDINNTVDSIMFRYKKSTGSDIIEFFNAVNMKNVNNGVGRPNRSAKAEVVKKQLADIEAMVNNNDIYSMNELFSQESGRFQLYSSYKLIYENIPQMAQALDTYVDNIMSPDDFTKDIFNIYLDDVIISTSEIDDKNEKIVKNCKNLIEHYNLDITTKRIIKDTLKLGDQFVAVLKLNDEISKVMLSEDYTNQMASYNKPLTESDIELSDDDIIHLSEMFDITNVKVPSKKPEKSDYREITDVKKLNETYQHDLKLYNEDVKHFNETKQRLSHDIAELLNKNLVFTEDSSCLLEDNVEISKQFNISSKKELFNNFQYQNKEDRKNLNPFNTNKSSKKDEIRVGGSVMKILQPERTIKLVLDDFEYGYYYIENLESNADMLTTGSYSVSSNIFTSFKSQANEKPDIINAKYRLITDVFVKNMAKKIDKKFINKCPEFKDTIYQLLKQNYLLNKQIRMVYLKPGEVVHFGQGTEDYYDSIYKSILFSAKLYLAVLTSQVMLRLVRSPEKRAFYIEVDLDNDTEAVVQQFMRDIKTRDIKMSNFGEDINTLLNAIGTFQDYYIPVVEGQKPVEIDTIPGMNVEITNDFLDYLLKSMISGMGIPPEFLSYSEQTEFARSLGMMNGKFVRSILVWQKILGRQFTKLFRLLYQNEFLNDYDISKAKKEMEKLNNVTTDENGLVDNKEEKNKVDKTSSLLNDIFFNLEKLSVKFPPPQALNMTTITERINNSREIIEFVAATLVDQDDAELQFEFKRELTKDILNTFDWEKYEKILEKSELNKTESKIKKASSQGEESSDNGGF